MNPNELWVVKSEASGVILGAAPTKARAEALTLRSPAFTMFGKVVVERFLKAPVPEIPRGFVGNVSMDSGLATFEDGSHINLLEVQAILNGAFSEHGDQEYATAADTMSKITGLFQGPYGEWEEAE